MTYFDEAQAEIVMVTYFRELSYEYMYRPVIAFECLEAIK